jgi:phospholipid/cholesterol/gamma-HCH transport system ATP-binding protein
MTSDASAKTHVGPAPPATAPTGEAPAAPAKEDASKGFALRVVDVRKRFGTRDVLKGVSVDVPRGTILVVLGGSGMGKSVLMKHMIGLLQPDAGQVIIDGEDISRLKALELKRVRAKIGMVFQNGALFDSMTSYENVAFPLRENRKDLKGDALDRRVRELFEVFSLSIDNIGPRFPSEISGGQRKRVALARSVALSPQIVLYDEPTTGLDPITTDQVDEMILDAKQKLGVTSVVISHDIASAFKIADHIIFIYEGEIVARGLKDEMLASEHAFVRQFFATWRSKNA